MIAGEHARRWSRGERARKSGRPRCALPARDRIASTGLPDPREDPVEHPPGRPVERTERGEARRRGAARRQQDRVEDRRGEHEVRVEDRGVREDMDAMDDDDVMAGQQRAQTPVVVLAVGEMEVAKDGDLLEGRPSGDFGRNGGDPSGVGMRAGDLDPHPGLREGGSMDRPADRGHLMAAVDEPPSEEDERRDVPGGADRRQRDPHRSDGGDAARRQARAISWRDDPSDLQQPLDSATLPAVRLEQLEHARVVGPRLAGERPGDGVRDVEVADAHRVGVAEGAAHDLRGGPGTDAGKRSQPARRLGGGARRIQPGGPRRCAADDVGAPALDAERVEGVVRQARQGGGAGGRSRSPGPGAGSPWWRSRAAYARNASVPVTFCSRTVGRRAWKTRRVCGRRSPGLARWRRRRIGWTAVNASGRSASPTRSGAPSMACSAPGPHAVASRRIGDASRRRSVAGPSGVRKASQASPDARRIVRSPRPWASGPSVAGRSSGPRRSSPRSITGASRGGAGSGLPGRPRTRTGCAGPDIPPPRQSERMPSRASRRAPAGARRRVRILEGRAEDSWRSRRSPAPCPRSDCSASSFGSVDHGVNRTPRPSMRVTFGRSQRRSSSRFAASSAAAARSGVCHASALARRRGYSRSATCTGGRRPASESMPSDVPAITANGPRSIATAVPPLASPSAMVRPSIRASAGCQASSVSG